jgi:D-beta-D-heptose 7-phosphate kinase/D-beta-D-heptose 1-phosphate adenosyltransferase
MSNAAEMARWREIIAGFSRARVLVIGDLMLDEYVRGEVERISPEAPVPVVRVISENWVPGGAANVANNVQALGGKAVLLGVVGADLPGRRLKKYLQRTGIDVRFLLVDRGRPTITKSRVMAGHQQVVRVDKEDVTPVGRDRTERLVRTARRLAADVDGVIIEDYAKGLISQEMVDSIIAVFRSRRKFAIVDPNEGNPLRFRGATVVTPNRREALAAAGLGRQAVLADLGRPLLKLWGAKSVLVTLGEEGMCLFEGKRPLFHIPTVAREVFDVSGAGDTVAGTLALALAAGADLREAAHLANFAAGVVVGKLGTATASREELIRTLDRR